MNEMRKMRVTERQQRILLGMRGPDPREWIHKAVEEVKAADGQGFRWVETSWGQRLTRR